MLNANQQGNTVEIEQLQAQPVASIRATIPLAPDTVGRTLGEAMAERLQALQDYLQQSQVQPAGPPFVRYHTFEATETDLETGLPVPEPVAGEGRIAGGELPGGPAITAWHTGPHEKLGEAYARIAAWQKDHGRASRGPAWEVYHWIDPTQAYDPATWDPSTWHTQLVQPI